MSIILEPMGGLGNQLFTYALAKELQARTDSSIYFRLNNYENRTNFNYELDSFKDGSDIKIIKKIPHGFIYDSRFFHFFMNNYPTLRRLKFPKIYYEKSMNFSPVIFNLTNTFVARGFFQSWRYFENSKDTIKAKIQNLNNESSWFKDLKHMLIGRDKFTAIHIRRGDYKSSPSLGLLDNSYYERAISLVQSMNSFYSNPVVFTDDEAALTAISSLSRHEPTVILAPHNSRPIESLLLMSLAKSIIIANSTFSWWSAWLSDAQTVIAPRPWLENSLHNDRDLLLPKWLTVGR